MISIAFTFAGIVVAGIIAWSAFGKDKSKTGGVGGAKPSDSTRPNKE